MDDIYDNLENYNEVNIVQELRSENKELKTKLEECSSAMDKLQKFILQDFDNMAAEFKKLEMNYSSLLKTARAEIERKTHIIKNLNMEKDIMVLNSLKNIRQSKFQVQKEAAIRVRNNSDSESVLSKLNPQPAKEKSHTQRLSEKRVPSEDTISSFDADNKTKVGTDRDVKVKIEESTISKPETKALGIANRRKSMPVLGKEYFKYTSDEEYDDSEGTLNEKRFSAKKTDRHRIDNERRQTDDKRRNRAFGSSYDRHDNYESRESGYRYRNNQSDRNRFKKAEEPEHRQRNKRYYSPKRSYRKDNRDLHDSKYYRSDYERGRVVVSPVSVRYNRKRSRDQRSNHDRDVYDKYERNVFENYEREVRENYEKDVQENFDENQHYDEEKQFTSHKINSDFDEPQSKRLKTSISEKFSDEDLQTDTNHLISCESPDYVSADNVSAALPVKEIMDTAATQLEDPRLASKKYMTVKNRDNIMLSTVYGRNIDLEIVNTATWNMMNKPRPLLTEPHFTEQIVKEIRMDLDNPISNITTESGEILDWEANDEFTDITPKNIQTDYGIENQPAETNALRQNKNAENIEQSAKIRFKRYKIPKTLKSTDSVTEVKGCTNEIIHQKSSDKLHNNSTKTDKDLKYNIRERTNSQTLLSDVTSDENIIVYKDDLSNISKSLFNREIVQNDLELSEDNVQPQNEITEEKAKKGLFSKKKEKGKKTHKQKKSKKVCDDANLDSNFVYQNTKTKEKEPVLEDMQTKFSDLFGDNSSLITPEDLQVATSEAHEQDQIPGQLDKYIDVGDTQNAVDLNFDVITKTKSDISENIRTDVDCTPKSNYVTNKEIPPKTMFGVVSLTIDSSHPDIKSEKLTDSDKQCNTISTKTYTRIKLINTPEESHQKCKAQNEISKKNKRNSIKSAESMVANKNEVDPSKNHLKEMAVTQKGPLKSLQKEKNTTKKKFEIESESCKINRESNKINKEGDNKLPHKSVEVYDISEKKDTPASSDEKTEAKLIKSKVNLDANVIDGMNAILVSNETTKVDKSEVIHCNAANCNEPDVKTVVISTGFQKLTAETEPNLECKLSRTQNDLITVLRIKEHSLKALATSTPQKECQENSDEIKEAVSSSNNTCPVSDNSETMVTNPNDTDVPDVRIFVKRRRRILKKPQ